MSPAPSTGCTLKKTEETVLIHGNGCRSRVRRVREHERASFSHIRSGDLREGARRSEGEWEHPVKVAQFGKKIILQTAKMDFPDDRGVEVLCRLYLYCNLNACAQQYAALRHIRRFLRIRCFLCLRSKRYSLLLHIAIHHRSL